MTADSDPTSSQGSFQGGAVTVSVDRLTEFAALGVQFAQVVVGLRVVRPQHERLAIDQNRIVLPFGRDERLAEFSPGARPLRTGLDRVHVLLARAFGISSFSQRVAQVDVRVDSHRFDFDRSFDRLFLDFDLHILNYPL